jgi:hypothetical protein
MVIGSAVVPDDLAANYQPAPLSYRMIWLPTITAWMA